MQHSNHAATIEKMLRATAIALVCTGGMIWLNQRSLNEYWAVHFHRESPWQSLDIRFWKQGALIMSAAESAKSAFNNYSTDGMAEIQTPLPQTEQPLVVVKSGGVKTGSAITAPSPQNAQQLSKWLLSGNTSLMLPSGDDETGVVPSPLYDLQGKALLSAGKKVLMIGDSMMEGVAPRVLSQLQKEHGIDGLNLSRRNTGLAYPGYFNWPETTQKALDNNPDVGLLVVFLGPNDPWSMPDGPGRPYLKFKSEAWETEYRNRIRSILILAQQHVLPVIWLLPPNMRSDKLSENMAWLNTLYSSEVKATGGIVLNVNELFGYREGIYSPTMVISGKKVSLRAPDGTHYSPVGQNLIAEAIIRNISFEQANSDSIDEE
ncbi:DUF459 domain-containing protein [Enterobacter kobei]|nr:DUF459 domain-containing protein [Enterobacter kobei]